MSLSTERTLKRLISETVMDVEFQGRPAKRKRGTTNRRSLGFSKKRIPLAGNPKCKLAKLRYVDTIAINAAAASTGVHVFAANDVFDPNVSGGGHQPLGFDQMMDYYDHFTVVGSKCSVRVTPSSETSGVPGIMGIVLSDAGTTVAAATSTNHLLEGRQTGSNIMWVGDRNHMKGIPKLDKSFSHKSFFCKPSYGDEYRGGKSASPTEKAFYEVFVASINANDPASYILTVTIDYIVKFSEPKELAQS